MPSPCYTQIDRQVLAAFLNRSAVRHSRAMAWIEACSEDAETILGFDRNEFADLLTRASHAHREYEKVTDRSDQAWADWYADYMLTHCERWPDGGLAAGISATTLKGAHADGSGSRKPESLAAERDELRAHLTAAMGRDGAVGSVAREVAWLLLPHLSREEELLYPALAALPELAKGKLGAQMAGLSETADRIRNELEYTAAEHQVVQLTLEGLATAAREAGDRDCLDLAHRLAAYLQMEQTVIYPAAILASIWSKCRYSTGGSSTSDALPPDADSPDSGEIVESALLESFAASDRPGRTHLAVGGPEHRAGRTREPNLAGAKGETVDQQTAPVAIPALLKAEHGKLLDELGLAAKVSGPAGDTARTVANLLHAHFLEAEEFALPPLGVLRALVRGEPVADARRVIAMAARLKTSLRRMLEEHRAILAALRKFEAASNSDCHRLALKIFSHFRMEEEVMYPAAILVGEYLKRVYRSGVARSPA